MDDIFNEIITENSLMLEKETDIQTPQTGMAKEQHIIVKMQKTQDKEIILKALGEK